MPLVLGDVARILVVGDDGGDLGVEPADADLVEQVQHGVVEFGDHDHDALRARLVGKRGLHVEAFDHRAQGTLDLSFIDALGRGKGDAHEELAGLADPRTDWIRRYWRRAQNNSVVTPATIPGWSVQERVRTKLAMICKSPGGEFTGVHKGFGRICRGR